MAVVTNTGPLIMLAKIDQLTLLQRMFTTVSIPPAVHRELLAKSGPEVERLETALAQYIEITAKPVLSSPILTITAHLEAGEQEAIALAHAQKTTLVIDERLGRLAARQLGIAVTGSAGILIESKRRGYIPAVLPLLEAARQHGYWLSDGLLAVAAKMTGEKLS